MTSPVRAFAYDVVLSLNASHGVRQSLPSIEEWLNGRRMVAATLDHRFYLLDQKNFMKGTIEAHNLDHLLFTLRPSSRRIVGDLDGYDLERFKEMSQTLFVLQTMARYQVAEAIVSGAYLDAGRQDTARVADIEENVSEFLADLAGRWHRKGNIRKQFPWLFSIEGYLPQLRDRRLTFLRAFSSTPVGAGREYDDHQIGNLEKDLFWVGFDPSYKAIPVEKPYPTTKWTALRSESDPGHGLFERRIRYCTRCCLPETMEGINLDELGICIPCRSSEEKMHINWEERQTALRNVIDSYRSDDYYDCMFPMGGGKDSTYQGHMLRQILDVTPLAATHGANWLTLTGRYNLENCLQKFDLDHIVFHMNRAVINRMARKSLTAIGDACWHCHIGAGAFTVQTGIAWQTGLMTWGESIAEADGRGSYSTQAEASVFYNLEVSARIKAEDMADEKTSKRDLSAWFYPSNTEIEKSDMRYIHLGTYFFWDEERQVEFIKRNYEWMESPVENTYKGFKSVECVMTGVHDYANFIKRGMGRATVQASQDVRRGLLTREEAFELAKEFDTQRPHALDFYLQITGLTEPEFESVLHEARKKSEYASKLDT